MLKDRPAGSTAAAEEKGTRLGTFHTLRFRDFRLLWTGTIFASAGQWIQQATIGWMVYDLSGSGVLLGAIGLMRSIPMLVVVPFAGVAADRMDRKRLMLYSQIAMFLLAFLLAVGLFMNVVSIWHLFVFSFFAGIAQTFNMPVRQTVVFDLVPRSALPNAIALNNVGFNFTRAFGPAVAGFLIAYFGPSGNFFIQSAAYLGVVASVILLVVPPGRKTARDTSWGKNLAEGFSYVARNHNARALVVLGVIPPLLLIPCFMALMPIFAKDVYQAGPTGLGYLLASVGVGGFAGAIFTASLGQFDRRGILQLASLFSLSLTVLAFSFATSMWLALVLLLLAGFFEMVYMSTNQAVLQLSTPNDMRGRVTSILSLNMALIPVGGLIAGVSADFIGAPAAVMILSSIALAAALAISIFIPRVRRFRLSELRPEEH